MDGIESDDTLLRRIHGHLTELSEKPQTPLDAALFRVAAYDLPGRTEDSLPSQNRRNLIIHLYQVLPVLQQSPAPLVHLLSKLLRGVRLSNILDIDPPVDFVAGLDLDSKAYHSLTLSLLEEGDKESAERLATNHRPVFDSLVKLWLCAEDEGIASRTEAVLIHLLAQGGDVVFKRMFRDKDVYELLYSLCSSQSLEPVQLSRTRKTIAQARLLGWLSEVAKLNWDAAVHPHHPEVEALYALQPGEGLLDFAALRMIDYDGDVLMQRTLINFFTKLLPGPGIMEEFLEYQTRKSSAPLEFLVSRGVHARTLKIYTHPEGEDSILVSFLYPEAAKYVAQFARTHPIPYNSDGLSKSGILSRLNKAFSIPVSQWNIPSTSPSADLHVLSSLPRASLLVEPSPVRLLPTKSPNYDVLHTLASLFHGPHFDQITLPPRTSEHDDALQAEVRCAGALYNNYVTPSFYADVVGHANRLAVPDASLAAHNLLKAIITAQWGGTAAVMAPDARSIVVPYVLGIPNRSVSVTSEAGEYLRRIAEARYGLAKTLVDRLAGRPEWLDVEVAMRQRVQDGVWGVRSGPGPTVAMMGSD